MPQDSTNSTALRTALSALVDATGHVWLDPLLQLTVGPVSEEMARRRSIALRAAEQLAGCSREELADRIDRNPDSVSRLIRLLYAAGQNGYDPVLRIMGSALARGLAASEKGDSSALEQEDAILAAISELGPQHFELLTIIRSRPNIDNIAIANAVKGSNHIPDLALMQLVSTALVLNPYGRFAGDNGETTFYEISPLGTLVLEAASQVAART